MVRDYVVCAASSFEYTSLKIKASRSLQFFEMGIGSIASAVGATKIAKEVAGKDVVFLGSCGAFDIQKFPLFSFVSPSTVCWEDLSVRLEQSYKVKGTEPELEIGFSPSEKLQAVPRPRAVCSPSITSIDAPRTSKTPKGEVENIELYGVYLALKDTVASFTPLLVVTNQVGPNSHAQWLENQKTAYAELAGFTHELIFV